MTPDWGRFTMRFFYACPGLINDRGHHAAHCRVVVKELGARGIDTIVLASRAVTTSLQEELGAIPFFRAFANWRSGNDPAIGWLNIFDETAEAIAADFGRLFDISATDLVYLNVLWPSEFMGLATWLKTLSDETLPSAIVEFAASAAVGVRESENGLDLGFPDPRSESRPLLYRFVGQKVAKFEISSLRLTTLNAQCSTIYSALLGMPVDVLPWPIDVPVSPRPSGQRKGATVSFLGVQRPDKGFHLVPEIVERLLREHENIKLVVHNASPERMPEYQGRLRDIAKRESRLELNERDVTPNEWLQLLEVSDLIVCPYDPAYYAAAHSGIVAEAIAHGIPLIVPAGTVLASLLREYGGAGVGFSQQSTVSICKAIAAALVDYHSLALIADAAAARWRGEHGPEAFVEALLALAQPRVSPRV